MKKNKDILLNTIVYLCAIFTLSVLVLIVGFIFIKGIKYITPTFIFGDYSAKGGGIRPMIITTLYMIALSIIIATPIGILSAVYLQEYAKQGKIVKIIRFATESLSGIPSIVYGLFGGIFFVVALNFTYSILSGALTVAIIILPIIIRTTEESLKTVPDSYREASLGLGATKFQTLYKVIVPSAIPGVLSGVILAMGRVIGESAAILLTAGTVAQTPYSLFDSARTLTVQAYLVTKENGDIGQACGVGIVLIVIILALNYIAKLISKRFNKANF